MASKKSSKIQIVNICKPGTTKIDVNIVNAFPNRTYYEKDRYGDFLSCPRETAPISYKAKKHISNPNKIQMEYTCEPLAPQKDYKRIEPRDCRKWVHYIYPVRNTRKI